MKKINRYCYLILLFTVLYFLPSCYTNKSVVEQNIIIRPYIYKNDDKVGAAAMPELKPDSWLAPYKRRFEYLYINLPKVHNEDKAKIVEIFHLYPDTNKMKSVYMRQLKKDKTLNRYFIKTVKPIADKNYIPKLIYTKDNLMEVASKFFYCDKILADTTIEAHVCVGLNGVKEANWDKDFILLEAFCYEAIFDDLDKDSSLVWASFLKNKAEAQKVKKENLTTLSGYLKEVKLAVFDLMKADTILQKCLMDYYNLNKNNLSFKIDV